MFNGDIRKERVERVMTLASQLTVQEMRSVVMQLTHLHDSIIMEHDPKWAKEARGTLPYGETYSNDPNWEKEF
jgi:hypothetical protein